MQEIMNSIFKEYEFELVYLPTIQNINSFYAISKNEQKINYYLVLFVDNLFDREKKDIDFNSFYEEIKKLEEYNDHRMDKNLSMLICAKREGLEDNEEISRKIYKIEEDPYFFKKYVLTYTSQQERLIRSEASLNSIVDFLYNTLNDHEAFLSFKSNPYKESVYNLVSKIFIKLPFLNLKNIHREIYDLSGNINLSLDSSKIELRNKALKYARLISNTSDETRNNILDFIGVEEIE